MNYSDEMFELARKRRKDIYEELKDLDNENKEHRTIIIDTETTGLNERWDEILQLSIIDENKNVLFNELLQPIWNYSWEGAERINHISPKMVKNKKTIVAYARKIQEIINNANCIIGYNVSFDLDFLRECGFKIPWWSGNKIIDIMYDFAKIYGEWNDYYESYTWQKLVTCAEYYNFDWNSTGTHAHDSLGDCFATLYCYKEMMKDKK